MLSHRMLYTTMALIFVAVCASQVLAQAPVNPGIFQQYPGQLSSTTRFWASDAGKNYLLHSPSPAAFPMLQKLHPEAASQYPQEPMLPPARGNSPHQPAPAQDVSVHPNLTVTGCGTSSGTVMNLEPTANATTQNQPSIDFLLSELGSGMDLVVETANDERGFDSFDGIYVHRDPTQPCYGGTDFEMGNPPIADPFYSGTFLFGEGNARVLADPNPAHKQFIFADLRIDNTTEGVGLRRTPASSFENTTTCPQGTLMEPQEMTCAGSTAVIVDASLDNEADAVSIAQDPRSSGTGAGDIYVVHTSIRVLRSVIVVSACKATFSTSADCSTAVIVSGSQTRPQFSSVAVVGGGPNAGDIVVTWVDVEEESVNYAYCTPGGAPNPPSCHGPSVIYTDPNGYSVITDNPSLTLVPWPVVAARTDASGQTVFVTFSDCKVSPFLPPLTGCVDADVQMLYATNLTSPTWTLVHVNTNGGHQIIPAIAYDTGQNIVTIGYYDTGTSQYKNATVMGEQQIPSGTTLIGGELHMTSAPDALEGNGAESFPFGPGDYFGIAAHGGSAPGSSRLYFGFTNNARIGRYDTIANTQADNNVSRATY